MELLAMRRTACRILLILFVNRMAYDDQYYLAEFRRYDNGGCRPGEPHRLYLDGSGCAHASG
jgi:hypothetical protein